MISSIKQKIFFQFAFICWPVETFLRLMVHDKDQQTKSQKEKNPNKKSHWLNFQLKIVDIYVDSLFVSEFIEEYVMYGCVLFGYIDVYTYVCM